MENHHYTCKYCKAEFIPKRRKVQKFCSTSCRVRHHQSYKGLRASQSSASREPVQDLKKLEVEKISVAGIGNAAIGTTAADLIKSLLTKEENKTATKADLRRLEGKLKRFHKINNMKPNPLGQYPFFDLETGEVVFRT
ncbi:hypothetical protein [Psychroflexus halocasei]|uniref:Uncharacterized protein n=1 Tax=Psychroflexus halocasei TaxID=908615 RepID=A0A1H3VEY1_9FLAO|nr:hypothetical protein [Psychroflexus halocasei]SDZ73345.1 hypothetical protein SAMN05421540_10156 [Psychroflexus halocasei]